MDGFKKDHHSTEGAEHSAPTSQRDEKKEAPVISPRRLRDRELLKRKKEEAREKDTYHEQNQTRSKRPRQTRGTGTRGRKQVKEPEPQLEPQPEPESKNEPDHKQEQTTELQHEPVPETEPNHHKDKKATEPQPQPEPIIKPDHKHEHATESQYEFEPEHTLGIEYDVQDLSQHKQEALEHLEHHEEPVIKVSEDEAEDEPYAVHEEADGHFQHDITTLMTDADHADKEVAVVEPEAFINPPEVLSFPLQETCTPEQEEHQYYTPLL